MTIFVKKNYSTFSDVDNCIDNLKFRFDIVAQIGCDYPDVESARLDLYLRLNQIRQDAFHDNQRLIFLLEHDFYDKERPAGGILQTIQTVVQDVDISNFFICIVTTNPNIQSEYKYIKNTISWDPVPFHLFECSGNFESRFQEYRLDGKLADFDKITQTVETLTDRQRHLLFQDRVFCMMPWVGINIDTNSETNPCCLYKGQPLGDVRNQSIEEIWNARPLREIRQKMLNGQTLEGCHLCYHKEKLKRDSLRNSINRDFAHRVSVIDQTRDDGYLDSQAIHYWDIRYNNLCNLACRSCGPTSSSSWYQIHNTLNPGQKLEIPLLQAGQSPDRVFDQISQHLDHVEKIYFAGGEPTMIENFYRILEMLDARGRNDVQLVYNINLTRLSLGKRSMLDLWNQFPSVSVGASLDAMGDRAEYLRTGTRWDDIVRNRRQIQERCPHVDFYVSATTGLINALHVADFHRSWVDDGLIQADQFNIQLLYSPKYLSVINAPDQLKYKIQSAYQDHLEWLTPLDRLGRAASGFSSIIGMCQEKGHYDSNKFWHNVGLLDRYHKTDLLNIFPELVDVGLR